MTSSTQSLVTAALARETPHTCLACRQTFFTFSESGFSQAFQDHVEICAASKYNFAGAAGEPFDLHGEQAREDYWHFLLDD